jgi:hypothetical protein
LIPVSDKATSIWERPSRDLAIHRTAASVTIACFTAWAGFASLIRRNQDFWITNLLTKRLTRNSTRRTAFFRGIVRAMPRTPNINTINRTRSCLTWHFLVEFNTSIIIATVSGGLSNTPLTILHSLTTSGRARAPTLPFLRNTILRAVSHRTGIIVVKRWTIITTIEGTRNDFPSSNKSGRIRI